jgi:hypothetical protein
MTLGRAAYDHTLRNSHCQLFFNRFTTGFPPGFTVLDFATLARCGPLSLDHLGSHHRDHPSPLLAKLEARSPPGPPYLAPRLQRFF